MQIYSSGINSSSQSYPLATVTGSRWASGAIQATEKLSCCCITSVVSDSVQPHRQQPTRLPLPWDSPGKNTEVGCRFLLQCMKVKMKVKSLSRVLLLVTPWTAAHQAPLSMGLSRQEYWSGVPLPSPGEAKGSGKSFLLFWEDFQSQPSLSCLDLGN